MWERWDGDWDDLETVIEEVIDAGDAVIMGFLSAYSDSPAASRASARSRKSTLRMHRPSRKVDFIHAVVDLDAAGAPPTHR